MQHLIIYAHPNPKSFSAAVCDRISALSRGTGNKVVIRDLYHEKFNPVLSADDFKALKVGNTPKDIIAEQNFVKNSDLITVIFPLWWTGYPAILKGWIDRVLLNGFAFKHSPESGITPLLTGKKVQLITTMGASVEEYEENGLMDAMAQTMGDNVWGFCGCEDAGLVVLGEVPGMGDQERAAILSEIEDTVLQTISPTSKKVTRAKHGSARKNSKKPIAKPRKAKAVRKK